jgi:metallo-beta-lactamase family protein
MNIKFLGAARQVTGSRYALEVDDRHILIDCGMHQERKFLDRNWAESPIEPKLIASVLITHAHIDHCGLLPKLVRDGFRGPIYTTEATSELLEIVLYDAARIQAEDAKFKQKRHRKEGRQGPHPVRPLFTDRDVQKTIPMIQELSYGQTVHLSPSASVSFHDAGHILGSAMVELDLKFPEEVRRMIFTGDLGQSDRPILRDPAIRTEVDYLVMESTYGNRNHGQQEPTEEQMARLINETIESGGKVLIPTFAIERAQELIYEIGQLIYDKKIPRVPVYLDSPMAGRVTKVFRRHRELFDEAAWARINAHDTPLRFPELKMVDSPEESKAINRQKGPAIIMATSGMCTAGRIKHHLTHNIKNSATLILFVGYQASGTLGRQILEGAKKVRIHGLDWPVRARVEKIHGFSGHADQRMLLSWLENFDSAPRQLFLTHGDEKSSEHLANEIRTKFNWEPHVPNYQETVELE